MICATKRRLPTVVNGRCRESAFSCGGNKETPVGTLSERLKYSRRKRPLSLCLRIRMGNPRIRRKTRRRAFLRNGRASHEQFYADRFADCDGDHTRTGCLPNAFAESNKTAYAIEAAKRSRRPPPRLVTFLSVFEETFRPQAA